MGIYPLYTKHVIKKGGGLFLLGGDNVSISETILLLNFIAVVIFGVINITKKK